MTIAIGLLAGDGLVIAADQQETSWPVKAVGDKVLSVVASRGAIAVTGAGSAGHLDAMAQEVCGAFLKSEVGKEEQAIRDSFSDFYSKHIVPLYPFEQRFPTCDIEAIVGVDTLEGRFILANEQTALRQCGSFVAVGSGAPHAGVVLSRTFVPDLPLQRAALLAAYAIYIVKETVEGCGKNTDVYMLQNGKSYQFGRWDQETLDQQFRRYAEAESVVLHHVLGRSGTLADTLPVLEMTRAAIAEAASKPREFAPARSAVGRNYPAAKQVRKYLKLDRKRRPPSLG